MVERGYRIVEHENPKGLPDIIIDVYEENEKLLLGLHLWENL